MKKTKRLLCLSLAIVTVFTASLSSTVSAIVDVEETNENQSFTSSIFNELLTQSEDNSLEDLNDNGISPLWLKNEHEKIIDFNNGDLPEYHIRILKCTSNWADQYFPSTESNAVANIPALHGAGNYVINLEFLWYFSVFLGRQNNPISYDDMNTKIKAARSSAIEKIKNTTAYKNKNDNQLQNLITYSGTLVKYDGYQQANNSKLTATEMRMRILGYAAHLVGDVYSHRTMLLNTNRLTMSLFTSNLSADVSKGIVEYRDLAHKYLLNESNKKHVNETCIDCPTYCPNRYKDAKLSVSCLVTEIAGAYDYYSFLCPTCSDVKLNNFKKYVKNSGLDTTELTATEWAKYST